MSCVSIGGSTNLNAVNTALVCKNLLKSKTCALLNKGEAEHELTFRYAVDRINNDSNILPQTTLIAHVATLDIADSFLAQQQVCGLLRNGVVAVLGPHDSIASMHVQSICETFEIPHIETRYDFESYRADLSLNLYPRPSLITDAIIDLIKEWRWKTFAVVYEDNSEIVFQKFFDRLLANALHDLDGNQWRVDPISCADGHPWPHGTTLLNYMRQNVFYGMTGLVKFDESGFRSDISLEILSLSEDGVDVV
ncbi:unnamed protein product, partial [Medioppia subpectinata]